MGILDNFEAVFDLDSYKAICDKCNKVFIAASDKTFTCLLCSK